MVSCISWRSMRVWPTENSPSRTSDNCPSGYIFLTPAAHSAANDNHFQYVQAWRADLFYRDVAHARASALQARQQNPRHRTCAVPYFAALSMRPAIRAGRAAAKSRLSAGESDGRRSRVPPPASPQAPLRKRGPINRQRSCVRGTLALRTAQDDAASVVPQGGPVNMRGDYVTSHF